jgi:hypothetical protein
MLILEGFPHGSPIPLTGLVKSAHLYVLRCQTAIQSGINEDQDGFGQENERVVGARTERAGAAGEHESAQGVDDVGQRIEMRNGL